MDINKEAVGQLYHGHKAVGTGRVQLAIAKYEVVKGILLRTPGTNCPTPNTVPVWVGGKHVTADSNPGTGGIPLAPGESLFIPCDNITALYVVSTADGQDLAWMAM
jgi:hypothetical protein